jgi:hypothetical protein
MKLCKTQDRNLSYQVSGDINSISEIWDAFLPQDHHLQSRFLKILPDSGLEDVKYHFLLIYHSGTCIGLASFQEFRFHSGHYDSSFLNNGPLSLIRQILICHETGILICGNLFHLNEEGFYFSDSRNRSLILEVSRDLERRLKPGALLLKDIQEPLEQEGLKEHRFRTFDQDLLMELKLEADWLGFDDYLASLGKKYRQRAKKILEATSSLEFRILEEDEISQNKAVMENLYQQVRQRQAIRVGSLNGNYFLEMKKAKKDAFEIRAWFDENKKMVAFSSHFLHPNKVREVHYIGFDSEANEKHLLYFNILFDGIRAGIENKESTIQFGRTGFDAKASAGAVPNSIFHYFRLKRGLPTITFNYMNRALENKEKPDWKNRNPFKEQPQEIIKLEA